MKANSGLSSTFGYGNSVGTGLPFSSLRYGVIRSLSFMYSALERVVRPILSGLRIFSVMYSSNLSPLASWMTWPKMR
jgi:uncharacterized membrane protein